MILPSFDLLRPTTVDEVLAARSEDALPYCGGTELLLAMRMGLLRPQRLIDLKGVAELRAIARSNDVLTIGATATHDQIARNSQVAALFPMLAGVEASVGNARVRVQGSIGGNLVFAEPKSDVAAALIALDAVIEVRSPDASRRVPVEDFLESAYWSDLEDDEILTHVEVPFVAERRCIYEKFQTMERPTVGVAGRVDADGSVRIVVAAATGQPVVFDLPELDAAQGRDLAAELEIIADLTGGERYKRHLVGVTIDQVTARLRQEDS